MIEKIMKAVKSSNKKRSRNITIGAVIGFLLSCTAVMGVTEDNYLWIKDDNGEIKFSTGGNWSNENPYSENSWNTSTNTYTNNITLSGKGNGVRGANYGLKLEIANSNSEFKFINNEVISGTGSGNSAYGILYNGKGKIEAITNRGEISGESSDNYSDSGYGINISSGTIETLNNTGKIYGKSSISSSNKKSSGSGINISGGTIGTLNNTGKIYGESIDNGFGINISSGTIETLNNTGKIYGESNANNNTEGGYGIYISSEKGKIETLNNTGIISGKSTGKRNSDYGIYISSRSGEITTINNTGIISGKSTSNDGYGICNSRGTIGAINNTGVIYGKSWAISNTTGTIENVSNYGILATQGNSVYTGKINNYGMYITKANGKITVGNEIKSSVEVVGYNEDGSTIVKNMTIRNATLNGEETETVSFGFKGKVGEYDNSILNGKDETLKVSGTGNQITDSIINAYETAVVMGSNSTLILNNTVVNGGLSGNDPTISITGNQSILTIQGNSVVNGEMTSIGENNTLNLYGKINSNLNKSNNISEAASMNILHNITGFTNMNIDNNVTFFEDVEVTGTKKVTIAETGTLNLRLKNTGKEENVGKESIPKATHAFSGNEMVIQGEGNGENTAGTLRFITNGIGQKIYVDIKDIELRNLYFKTSSVIDGYDIKDKEYIILGAYGSLEGIYKPENTGKGSQDSNRYESLNNIYKGIYSSTDDNLNALRVLISSNGKLGNNYDENMSDEEQLKNLLSYLGSIYTETPYSYSSELSRKSAGMFRDIVTENQFRPDLNRWLVMGGLTHADGGTKDSYYGQNYHGFDTGTADVDTDMKLTGAYALGKYGYSENVSLGVTAGGNKSEAKLPMSKVKGNSGYVGAFAENYRGNLTLKAGAGIQYSEYDANRATLGGHSYSDKYSDMTYDIYLNGRYSNPMGDNFFLEPYGTLSYTYVDQEGADEGSKVLAIETDSKSFDYTAAKVGVDLKKVIPHEKGKSTLSAGVSYTRLLNGADKDNITGRFKGKDASDFDILVAHKNENSIGLNAKYTLELESGILFDVKGSYSVERDSHNGTGKNRNKGEWIVGTGLGYKF